MKGSVSHRHGARQDVVDIYRRYVREGGVGVADRFLASAEATFLRLSAMPGMGTRYEHDHPALAELRFFPLSSHFKKFVVFYRPVAGGIEIIRVLHGARDISSTLAEGLVPVEEDDDEPAG